MALVVDVGEVVLLEGGRALEAELEVTAALDDGGDLGSSEEAAALEVVELLGHPLHAELDDVRHGETIGGGWIW